MQTATRAPEMHNWQSLAREVTPVQPIAGHASPNRTRPVLSIRSIQFIFIFIFIVFQHLISTAWRFDARDLQLDPNQPNCYEESVSLGQKHTTSQSAIVPSSVSIASRSCPSGIRSEKLKA
jgi:hypothetical protein